VTGSSRGLGFAMARALSSSGATVALVARDAGKLNAERHEIESSGGEAAVFLADVTNEQDVSRLESEISGQLGAIHILVNNAGTNIRKNLIDFTLDEWRSVIDSSLHQHLSDVPGFRASYERLRLRTDTQHGVHYESRIAPWPQRLLVS